MPAIANVVVADATPTNHTLYPLSAAIASSRFNERAAHTVAGNRALEIKLALANATRPTDRVTVLYSAPYEVLQDGAYVVNDIMRFSGEFVLATTIPSDIREDFVTEVKNLMAHALVMSYARDRDPCY